MTIRSIATPILLVLLNCLSISAEEEFSEGEKLFALEVMPILADKCFSCHGDDPDEIEGELDLTTRAKILKGGEFFDDVLIPGDAEFSFMMEAVRWEDPDFEMPPKENDRLSEEQTWMLRDWINAGAPWIAQDRIAAIREKHAEGVIVQTSGALSEEWANRRYKEEDLWAYQPIDDPAIPESKNGSKNPIDAFINDQLEEKGIPAAKPADRATLIRRATFDLIGLPPTPEEVETFKADKRSDSKAFQTVVDRLLADSRYGEQWGRHWLDVVRYADTSGYSNDFERTSAWRYRDYVIRSFNDDKPYDQFIKEQIAGDENNSDDPESLIATGFLRMGPWEHTGMSVAKLTRQQFLDDVTDTVGQAVLSHPLQCARCHDHKFDPIPTKDYYRLQAVFATTQFVDRETPFLDTENTNGFEEDQLYKKRIDYWKSIQSEIQISQDAAIVQWCEEKGIPVASYKELRAVGRPEAIKLPRLYGLSNEDIGKRKVVTKNLARIAGERRRYSPDVLSVYSGVSPKELKNSGVHLSMPSDPMKGGAIEASHILTGGDPFANGDSVTPGVLSALPGSNDTVEATDFNSIPEDPIGRRSALSDWLTSPQNPLTPRSIVNRIWSYHFGEGIAANPNNFGAMGKKPTHPELLDHLSARFIENGWSLKALHRSIMLSDTYRRTSSYPNRDLLDERDPLGQSYAAFNPRRLAAEEIRDSMLFVSGELNSQMGGIPIRPEINLEVALQPRQVMGSYAASYEASKTPEQRNRRSVYAHKIRGLRNPFFEVFNQPSPDLSCEARDSSTVTPQAFALFNSEDTLKRSIALAVTLIEKTDTRKDAIKEIFNRAYGRKPSASESRLCIKHWNAMKKRHEGLSFKPTNYPQSVKREAVEEMTGESFTFVEKLVAYEDYTPDIGFADIDANTRALAEVCLVVFNSNEFLYVY